MSVGGIGPGVPPSGFVPGLGRRNEAEDAAAKSARSDSATQAAPPATEQVGVRAGANAVPEEAPPGTDPQLWAVLSPEERSFFARAREMGPLTYGPGRAPDAAIPTALQGGRIDVRV